MKTLFLLVILIGLSSCKNDKSSTSNDPNKTAVELKFVPKINNTDVDLNKYYLLSGTDSIMTSRIDFYVQYPYITSNKSNQFALRNLSLISIGNKSSMITQDSIPKESSFTQLNFICGLSDSTNSTNPTSVADSNPLSNSKNMYWTQWTKYRYIIFEGSVKRANGTIINYSYHTGLEYKAETIIKKAFQINQGQTNTIVVNFNIEKVFFPNSGNNLKVFDGEQYAHSDAQDFLITNKFLINFVNSFSL